MPAAIYDFIIEQGATVDNTVIAPFALKNEDGTIYDLTDWVPAAKLRNKYNSATGTAFTVTPDLETGQLQLSLTATETAALAAGDYVYDVEISRNNVVRRVIKGAITVDPEATK